MPRKVWAYRLPRDEDSVVVLGGYFCDGITPEDVKTR